MPDEYSETLREKRRRAHVQVTASTFSPCGSYIVAGTSEGRICCWHMAALRTKQPDLNSTASPGLGFDAHTGSAYSLCFANNGGVLLSGGDDGVRAWDWATIVAAVGDPNIQIKPS